MGDELVRIGPVDDWVRTVAHHLRTDTRPVTADRADLDRVLDGLAGRSLLLSCDIRGLSAVLLRLIRRGQVADVPVGWVPDADRDSRELSGRLGLPARPTLTADIATTGPVRRIRLVRDDHGGLLLHRGTLTPSAGRLFGARSFGAQAYHDDVLVADGPVRRIEVRPDYIADCAVRAEVHRSGLANRVRRSTGRSLQSACAEATATVDGVVHPRPVTRWTWYADPRQHWLLRTPGPPAGDPAAPAPR